MSHWVRRGRAASTHVLISTALALAAAGIVLFLWYPYPYREISGGRELFLLLVSVDAILGPAITFAVFNPDKTASQLRRDLAVVGMLQLLALGYGLWTVAIARPAYLVFEFDRFRVVHAIDVIDELESKPEFKVSLPWTGPVLLAVRPFRTAEEEGDATLAALGGAQLAFRPALWEPYIDARSRVLAAARPAAQLRSRFPRWALDIDAALKNVGHTVDDTAYLPMVGRKSFWTAFIDPSTAAVVAYLPLDSF